MEKIAPTSIDEYIAAWPAEIQEKLKTLRAAIHAAAPDASEKISYQMPTFYLFGNLVHFAAFKDHLSFFPTGSGVEHFLPELNHFKTSKGTIQLPFNEPLPLDLINRITKFRVEENLSRAKAKKK